MLLLLFYLFEFDTFDGDLFFQSLIFPVDCSQVIFQHFVCLAESLKLNFGFIKFFLNFGSHSSLPQIFEIKIFNGKFFLNFKQLGLKSWNFPFGSLSKKLRLKRGNLVILQSNSIKKLSLERRDWNHFLLKILELFDGDLELFLQCLIFLIQLNIEVVDNRILVSLTESWLGHVDPELFFSHCEFSSKNLVFMS